MNCSNCNVKLTCGCQKRIAVDGKACCSTCVTKYNESLKSKPAAVVNSKEVTAPKQTQPNIAPVVNRIILTKNKR